MWLFNAGILQSGGEIALDVSVTSVDVDSPGAPSDPMVGTVTYSSNKAQTATLYWKIMQDAIPDPIEYDSGSVSVSLANGTGETFDLDTDLSLSYPADEDTYYLSVKIEDSAWEDSLEFTVDSGGGGM